MLGVGAMGAIDEIVFHQLLQWHHFYMDTTERWRIVSDGLFHAFTAALLLVGAIRLWHHRRRIARIAGGRPFWSAFFLGAGGFQVFDGLINHKLLRLHQVREGVDNLILYDIVWIAGGLLLLIIGWFLWRDMQVREAR